MPVQPLLSDSNDPSKLAISRDKKTRAKQQQAGHTYLYDYRGFFQQCWLCAVTLFWRFICLPYEISGEGAKCWLVLATKTLVVARDLVTLPVINIARVLDQRSNAFAKNQLIVALDKGILVVVLDENNITQLGAIVPNVAPSQRHGRIVRHVPAPAIVLSERDFVGHVYLENNGHGLSNRVPHDPRFVLSPHILCQSELARKPSSWSQ
jgi:hypothetical protein